MVLATNVSVVPDVDHRRGCAVRLLGDDVVVQDGTPRERSRPTGPAQQTRDEHRVWRRERPAGPRMTRTGSKRTSLLPLPSAAAIREEYVLQSRAEPESSISFADPTRTRD